MKCLKQILLCILCSVGALSISSCDSKLSSEELNAKYGSSVVLIKKSFFYKIKLGSSEYFFKEFNKETGELSELLSSEEEARKNPNVICGTGFFISTSGEILTCNHVIDQAPSAEDQKQIFDRLRKNSAEILSSLKAEKEAIVEKYNSVANYLVTYGYYLSAYDYAKYDLQKQDLKDQYDDITYKLFFAEYFNASNTNPDNIVSIVTTEFGVLLNRKKFESSNDFIPCDVVKVSSDKNVDLAVIQPENKKLPDSSINVIDFSRISQIDEKKLTLNEKIRMIGFNDGLLLAITTGGTDTKINSQLTEGLISQNSDEFKLMYTIPALPGSSGSPVFDEYGKLVSVNFAGRTNSQSFNYGIQPSRIKNFLSK